MLEGVSERILKEIEARAPKSIKVKVIATPERKFGVWRGGSTLAYLSSLESLWITKQDFDEHGAQIVHKKCF
jgi:actin, other eukaryote